MHPTLRLVRCDWSIPHWLKLLHCIWCTPHWLRMFHCDWYLHLHLSLNREGHWGFTDDFTTSFLHFSLFPTALWDLANSRPVHFLMLSSHLFFYLPCLLLPFTAPWKMILARLDKRKTCPYHFSLRLFTMARRSSCGPFARWILALISSLVLWSLYEMRSILR